MAACLGLGLGAVRAVLDHAGHQAAGVLRADFGRRNVLCPEAYARLDADGLVFFPGRGNSWRKKRKPVPTTIYTSAVIAMSWAAIIVFSAPGLTDYEHKRSAVAICTCLRWLSTVY